MNSFITASQVHDFKKCRFKPYLDRNGDTSLRKKIHPLLKLLWDKGIQYEKECVDSARKRFPDKTFVSIGANERASKGLADQTVAAMEKGIDYIYQGLLLSGNRWGRPDILAKENGLRSKFGEYLYHPTDMKLGEKEVWPDGKEKKVSGEHQWQLYFYAELLADVQGVWPTAGFVYKDNVRKRVTFTTEPRGYRDAISYLEGYQKGSRQGSEPAISSKCDMCPWQDYCSSWAEKHDDVSLLYYVGPALKYGFKELGITTRSQLSMRSEEELIPKVKDAIDKGHFWASLNTALVKKSIQRAKVSKKGKPMLYRKPEFPMASGVSKELHYDIENDPTLDFIYLHGIVVIEEGKKPDYHAFFADKPSDEEKVAKEMMAFIEQHPDAPIYHYAPHEKNTLMRLVAKSYLSEESVSAVFGENGRAFDLYQWIQNNSDWPLTSYSLKTICSYLGFLWSAKDAGGANSVVWINEYLDGDKAKKDKITRYNREDCLATYFLTRKLVEIWNSQQSER